jgi:hypothetical protein
MVDRETLSTPSGEGRREMEESEPADEEGRPRE